MSGFFSIRWLKPLNLRYLRFRDLRGFLCERGALSEHGSIVVVTDIFVRVVQTTWTGPGRRPRRMQTHIKNICNNSKNRIRKVCVWMSESTPRPVLLQKGVLGVERSAVELQSCETSVVQCYRLLRCGHVLPWREIKKIQINTKIQSSSVTREFVSLWTSCAESVCNLLFNSSCIQLPRGPENKNETGMQEITTQKSEFSPQ